MGRLEQIIEELPDELPAVPVRRFDWGWVLRGLVVAVVAGVAVLAVVVVWPWLARMEWGGGRGGEERHATGAKVAPTPVKEKAKEGGETKAKEARWDELFDMDGVVAPTGPEVIGGEAGVAVVEGEGGEAASLLPLEKSQGRCGFEGEEPGPETAGYRVVYGEMGKYGSLYTLLQKNGVDPNAIQKVIGALEKVSDPKSIRTEDAFQLYLDEKTGKFKFFVLKRSDTKIYHVLAFESGTLSAHKVEVPTERKWVKAGGVVSGSLYTSVKTAGLDGLIVNDFMGVFGAYAKFSSETRDGDTFRVIVSGEWLGKQFVGYDPPQVLQYTGQKTGDLLAIYYEPAPGKGQYYWPDGTSLKRLVADVPLDNLRVTSPFDPNRMHPVLKVKKPHLGTDFGAPSGTPVYAFDGGVVKAYGMKGAIGNMVHLDHGGGIETYYGHLSGFAKGMTKGKKVAKGEVIGYVGNTGRSTGPHLHFGLKKAGKFVDAMKYLKVTTIKEKPIDPGLEEGFEKRVKTLLAMLSGIKVPDLPAAK